MNQNSWIAAWACLILSSLAKNDWIAAMWIVLSLFNLVVAIKQNDKSGE